MRVGTSTSGATLLASINVASLYRSCSTTVGAVTVQMTTTNVYEYRMSTFAKRNVRKSAMNRKWQEENENAVGITSTRRQDGEGGGRGWKDAVRTSQVSSGSAVHWYVSTGGASSAGLRWICACKLRAFQVREITDIMNGGATIDRLEIPKWTT